MTWLLTFKFLSKGHGYSHLSFLAKDMDITFKFLSKGHGYSHLSLETGAILLFLWSNL